VKEENPKMPCRDSGVGLKEWIRNLTEENRQKAEEERKREKRGAMGETEVNI